MACANIGTPDGGPYDEEPPHVVSTSPKEGAVNNKHTKIVLEFDENIKLENAYEKVVVSPPQANMPEISSTGKRITVELQDSLLPERTYTIDFADAIQDNNEGNPMGDYAFSFSTGAQLDTFQVSGYVLNSEDLEPIKGILVGLYTIGDSTATEDLPDSIFRTQPFERISRTDSRGHFVIKGLSDQLSYRLFALQDADGDYKLSQKSERLAFSHEWVKSTAKPDIRYDTVWHDSIHYDSIVPVHYTHFYPDDLTLLAFIEEGQSRAFLKSERQELRKFTLFFTAPDSLQPTIQGLNWDSNPNGYVVEKSPTNDTLTFWLRDTLIYYQDTLEITLTYRATDTLGLLQEQTDTLTLVSRQTYEKFLKEREKQWEEYAKEYRREYKEKEKERLREAARAAKEGREEDAGLVGATLESDTVGATLAVVPPNEITPPEDDDLSDAEDGTTARVAPTRPETAIASDIAETTLASDTAGTAVESDTVGATLAVVPPEEITPPEEDDLSDADADTVGATLAVVPPEEPEEPTSTKSEKKKKKKQKKNSDEDIPVPPMPEEFLAIHTSRSQLDPDQNYELRFDTPVDTAYTERLHFVQIIDSDTIARPFLLRRNPGTPFKYTFYAEWEPDCKYELQGDTGVFMDIYHQRTPAFKKSLSVKPLSTYATLFLHLKDTPDGTIIQLLDQSGKLVKQQLAYGGKANFYFISPGTYYVKAIFDANGDGRWTTGDYDAQRQGEDVYFYPGGLSLRADWEITQDWTPTARPRYEQKPEKITKQKADKKKTSRELNAKRDEKKSKEKKK